MSYLIVPPFWGVQDLHYTHIYNFIILGPGLVLLIYEVESIICGPYRIQRSY